MREVTEVVILWTQTSGYLAACVRELAARDQVRVTLVRQPQGPDTGFDESWPTGLALRTLDAGDAAWQSSLPADIDLLFVCGWHVASYRRIARRRRGRCTRVLH